MIDRLDIHAYADRELAPDEMNRAEAEIAKSPDAQRELEAIRSLKSCLTTKLDEHTSTTSWQVCVDRLDELDRVKKAENFVGKYAWALCALLFVVILVGGTYNRNRGGSVGIANVASMGTGLIPTPSPRLSQPEQLRSWIQNQTGLRPTLRVDPARVAQIRISDEPIGRIVEFELADSDGFVSLRVIPNVSEVTGVQPIGQGFFAGQINGHNVVTWGDSGSAVFVIGDRTTDQLKAIAVSLYR